MSDKAEKITLKVEEIVKEDVKKNEEEIKEITKSVADMEAMKNRVTGPTSGPLYVAAKQKAAEERARIEAEQKAAEEAKKKEEEKKKLWSNTGAQWTVRV